MCFKELDDLTTRVGPVCLHIIREISQVIQGRMVDLGWNMHTPTEAIGRRFHTVMAKSVLILFCCSDKVNLRIGDLDFADIERESIKTNQIRRTIMIYHSTERPRSDTII